MRASLLSESAAHEGESDTSWSLCTNVPPFTTTSSLSSQLAAGLLCMQGQTAMLPSERSGLHPLVLPICKDAEGRVTGLLKLPLKPATDLPVVRTTGKHLELLSPTLQQLIKRTVVQMEFDEDAAAAEVRSAAEKLGITVEAGVKGSPFGLERFILVKVTITL